MNWPVALFLVTLSVIRINAKVYYRNNSVDFTRATYSETEHRPSKKKPKKKKPKDSLLSCSFSDSLDCYDDNSDSDSDWYTDETTKKPPMKKPKPPKKKPPKKSNFVDLNGYIRAKFAMSCFSSRSSVSVVCSPLGALFPAGMLVFGAEGKTLSEIYKALGLRASRSTAHNELRKLRKRFQDIPGVDIYMASRMYLSNRKKLRSGFKEEAEKVFHACTALVDMQNPGATASAINNWVKAATGGKIPSFIRENEVPVGGSLILVNAINFEGRWKYPFKPCENVIFHGRRGARNIPFMAIEQTYRHGASSKLDAEIIEIPYRKEAVNLVVILPRRQDGLDVLIKQLSLAPQLMNSITWEKKKKTVLLPRFSVKSTLDLRALYKMVGLKRVFRDHQSSGLKNIMRGETVFVDSAQQTVTICMCPDGTIASVASEGGLAPINNKGLGKESIFLANHPFLYFIVWDKEQLFAGTFRDSD